MRHFNTFLFSVTIFFLSCAPKAEEQPSNSMKEQSPVEEVFPQPIKTKFVHIVFFWLKDDTAETSQAFEASLKKFINSSAHVKYMHIGKPAGTPRDVVDNSYSYSLIATFNSKEEQDQYQQEQVHLDFIEEANQYWDRVQVYDSIME